MPAKKRTTTSVKKNAKKPSRLKKLFNPRDFKSGMLLFAVIFAVVGGSYFVYRSFAATNPDILFSVAPITSSNSNAINTVKSDGTDIKNVATADPNTTLLSYGKYSASHTFVAWTSTALGPNAPTNHVFIKDLTPGLSKSQALKSYALPQYVTANDMAVAPLTWSPDDSYLVIPTYNSNTSQSKLQKMNTKTGAFTVLTDVTTPGSNNMDLNGYTVLNDKQTIVYGNSKGIQLLRPGSTTPVTIRGGVNQCSNFRARPNSTTEFSYICYVSGGYRLYRQTPTTAAVLIATPANYKNSAATDSYLSGTTWSPDGSKLALAVDDIFGPTTACGPLQIQTRVATSGLTQANVTSLGASNKVSISGSCAGGTVPEANVISWAADGQSIIFLAVSKDGGLVSTTPSTINKISTSAPYTVTRPLTGTAQASANILDIGW